VTVLLKSSQHIYAVCAIAVEDKKRQCWASLSPAFVAEIVFPQKKKKKSKRNMQVEYILRIVVLTSSLYDLIWRK